MIADILLGPTVALIAVFTAAFSQEQLSEGAHATGDHAMKVKGSRHGS